ncbi:MAG: HD domain-containing protein [Chlorobi bacterium]|nr:HD domain-containing protein [Chlorobiota bacterium]
MLNQKTLREIEPGEKIKLFLVVQKIEMKKTRSNKDYLDLVLRDKSASVSAKMWDASGTENLRITAGSVVKIAASVETFNEQKQLKIISLSLASKEDNVSAEDFLPKSNRNLDEMIEELDGFIASVKNRHLNELLSKLLSGKRREKYLRAPAGKAWHHSYIHGLLEHTLEIAKICDLMSSFHPLLNRDLLIAGALLHDFGKTEELKSDASFDYTDKGRLLGHIVIAAIEIEKNASQINGFPEELLEKLIHLVLSHQGKLEHASPVEPKLIEAIALYHADELSAQTNAYIQAVNGEKDSSTGWTRFLQIPRTMLMIPKEEDEIKETLFD